MENHHQHFCGPQIDHVYNHITKDRYNPKLENHNGPSENMVIWSHLGGSTEHTTQTPFQTPNHLGKFHHELTTSEPWESWLDCGESSPFMGLIQVCELL